MDRRTHDFQVNDLIGKPFRDMGRGPDCFDCFGLVMEVFRRQGIELPDYGAGIWADQAAQIDRAICDASDQWTALSRPVRGCLIALRFPYPHWVSHLGVMLDGERFINVRLKTKVVIDRISSPAWRRRIAGFYKYRSQETESRIQNG